MENDILKNCNVRSLVLLLGLSLSYAALPQGSLSQVSKVATLTREQVVIRNDRASVYLCVDRGLWKGKVGKEGDVLWLRIFNNTIWTIRFKADGMGTKPRALKLSNGTVVPALTKESIAVPHYQVDANKNGGQPKEPVWGDFSTVNFLPSDTSALFSVQAKYLKAGSLFVEYKYEWEFVGAVAEESNSPVHRVYFRVADISDVPNHQCDR